MATEHVGGFDDAEPRQAAAGAKPANRGRVIPAGGAEPQRSGFPGDPARVFKALFESAPDAIVAVDRDGLIVLANAQSELLFGYRSGELIGRPIETLLPERYRDAHRRLRKGFFANPRTRSMGAGLELFGLRSDGSEFPTEISLSSIASEDGVLSAAAVRDVTERHRLALALEHAREAAQRANAAKSEFLARMSHELRTPLNAIVGFGQLLQLEELGPRQSEDVGHVLKAAGHLLALINEVLDLARIEAGQMTISPEPVALADTIHDALALVAPAARDRHVTLDANTNGLADDRHVLADRNRLKQVLLNLLSNAIKYNRPRGRVEVSYQMTERGRVRTSIVDTGIGIQPGELARLFEPFERLGAELTEVEGTGLGLTLSRGLIEAMGGTIEVDSQPGAGTTFVVELAAAERPGNDQYAGPARELAELGSPDGKRQRILYIEDNLSNLTLVERILERYPGVELTSAMQGTLGLELARKHRTDLIVLDLHLPDMPGMEVLKRLKADQPTREIPVVVLTADASKGQSERVTQLGATDYLTKPLDVPKFIEVIALNLHAQPVGKR